MKIYDCFTFFNELDLLELRLEELSPYVDYFVISEGDKTHSGLKKEFIFEKNKNRYKRFLKKIIYIKVEMPEFNWLDNLLIRVEKRTHGFITRFIGSNFRVGKWKLENYQRSNLKRGLLRCDNEDIIMVSDLDEIPNPKKFREMKSLLKQNNLVGFKQRYFNHYLNGFVNDLWVGTKACKFSFLRDRLNFDPQNIRLERFHYLLDKFGLARKIKIIGEGGWHFNNIGNSKEVIEKIISKAEADLFRGDLEKKLNKKDLMGYFGLMNLKVKYVPLDKSFPKAVLNHRGRYSRFIKKI